MALRRVPGLKPAFLPLGLVLELLNYVTKQPGGRENMSPYQMDHKLPRGGKQRRKRWETRVERANIINFEGREGTPYVRKDKEKHVN
jgi:hypothetical protein